MCHNSQDMPTVSSFFYNQYLPNIDHAKQEFRTSRVLHVKKSGNKMAHELARHAQIPICMLMTLMFAWRKLPFSYKTVTKDFFFINKCIPNASVLKYISITNK